MIRFLFSISDNELKPKPKEAGDKSEVIEISQNPQRIRTASSLIVFMMILLIAALAITDFVNNDQKLYSYPWTLEEGIKLERFPKWLYFSSDTLFSLKVITEDEKKELIDAQDVYPQMFISAVNGLALVSLRDHKPISFWLFILCGVLSALGASLRSMWDFIGHTCYSRTLQIDLWWPWYLLRLFIAFTSGGIFYLLISGGAYNLNGAGSNRLLIIGVACLVGFGLNDFIERLRLISKATFGTNGKKEG